jgi:hypothetical protein
MLRWVLVNTSMRLFGQNLFLRFTTPSRWTTVCAQVYMLHRSCPFVGYEGKSSGLRRRRYPWLAGEHKLDVKG